ncbi:transcription factor Ouib isoform X1 [Drosophila subpulchrella]|uniref:transcription factor Ouib isoform X1 n=1 Tax=Drosophila subpulchrella TaxID=1486046 RepID=UPI0018A1B5A5|nr:transcription factor Ouib isoform X1 [Drosophila subpulchrella]
MNIAQVCRICANKIRDQKRERNVFKYLRGKLLLQLKVITGVELTRNQGLPEFICERCFSELDLATKFRERCIFSQKYLLDIRNKSQDPSIVYIDEGPEPLDEQLIDADQLEAQDDEEFLVYEEMVEDGEDMDEFPPDDDPEASVMAAAEAAHQADIQEQQLERAAKRRRNFFICDECGQLFNDEYVYNEHLDGHQDRREMKQFFPCPDCPKTYTKKALLKQHRAQVHTGHRQFRCSICNEVFSSLGAKLRHEKAHQNERPYPCLECGRIFSSVSALQAHCSTHLEENRKFRCEPCNKDFLSRKDLLEHTKTKPHKRLAQHMQDEIELIFDS